MKGLESRTLRLASRPPMEAENALLRLLHLARNRGMLKKHNAANSRSGINRKVEWSPIKDDDPARR